MMVDRTRSELVWQSGHLWRLTDTEVFHHGHLVTFAHVWQLVGNSTGGAPVTLLIAGVVALALALVALYGRLRAGAL